MLQDRRIESRLTRWARSFEGTSPEVLAIGLLLILAWINGLGLIG